MYIGQNIHDLVRPLEAAMALEADDRKMDLTQERWLSPGVRARLEQRILDRRRFTWSCLGFCCRLKLDHLMALDQTTRAVRHTICAGGAWNLKRHREGKYE